MEHLAEKHGGSTLGATTNVARSFLPWTVTRDVWHAALRPDVSGIVVDALLFYAFVCGHNEGFIDVLLQGPWCLLSTSAWRHKPELTDYLIVYLYVRFVFSLLFNMSHHLRLNSTDITCIITNVEHNNGVCPGSDHYCPATQQNDCVTTNNFENTPSTT